MKTHAFSARRCIPALAKKRGIHRQSCFLKYYFFRDCSLAVRRLCSALHMAPGALVLPKRHTGKPCAKNCDASGQCTVYEHELITEKMFQIIGMVPVCSTALALRRSDAHVIYKIIFLYYNELFFCSFFRPQKMLLRSCLYAIASEHPSMKNTNLLVPSDMSIRSISILYIELY